VTSSGDRAGEARTAPATAWGDGPFRVGTFIARDGIIVYASDGLAALTGRTVPQLLGRPAADLIVPEDRPRVREIRARRAAGEEIPTSHEVTVLLPDGTRRLVESHFDLDGPETIVHLRELGAGPARRHLLEAVAAVGVAIRAQPDEERVLARVREELGERGVVSALLRLEDDRTRILWVTGPPERRARFAAIAGAPLEGLSGPAGELARRAVADGAAFTDDWGLAAGRFVAPEVAVEAREILERDGFGRAVGVRIDRQGETGLFLAVASPILGSEDLPAFRLFGAQVSAALEVARTISDLSRRNAHLAALARVGELASEATDLGSFFSGALEAVRPVAGCVACAVYVPDEAAGDLVRVHVDSRRSHELSARSLRVPLASPLGEVLLRREPRVAGFPFTGLDPALVAVLPYRAIAWVPLVARSKGVGVLAAGFVEGGIEAANASLGILSAASVHFASVIESHRLLSDLRRRVEELTLLVDVARASAQLDPVLLLDAALRRVCATFGAEIAGAWLRERDRLHLLSSVGMEPECVQAVRELDVSEGAPGEALQRRAAVRSTAEVAFGRTLRSPRCPGPGPVLAVPLLAKNDAVGALLLVRAASAAVAFTDGEAALLSSIGVQLGLAVDAARLFTSVRRRLSDFEAVQALTLRVFANAPGDIRALLQDACREIARALFAPTAAVFFLQPGSTWLRPVASFGLPPALEGLLIDSGVDGITTEVMRTRAPQQTPDMVSDPRSQLAGRADLPALSALVLPLAARRDLQGVVYVADRAGRRFEPDEVAVASALTGALGLAVENAELYSDARRRAEQLGLLHQVGRSLVETLDLEQILAAGVRNLARIVDAPDVYLCLASQDGATLDVRAVAGAREHLRGTVLPARPADHNLASRVIASREPILVADATDDPRVQPELVAITGVRAALSLPLVVRDRAIGAIVIVETRGPRLFTPPEVERAAAVANQLAVAADNARLYDDLRRSYSDLARAQQQLVQRERLAALGELSAVVAHEVRNPLGVIFNSLGSLRRLVRPSGDVRTLFQIVEEEAERLNRIVGDLLDFARPTTPEQHPGSLAQVAEEAIAAVAAQQGAIVEVVREFDPALPPAPIDPRLVRQAVVNVAANAVQAMPRGGRMVLRTLRDGDMAVVEIEDSGPGIPLEVRERIFEPFFTTKASGTGLGLAVVRRIVEGHGGEVRVRSAPGNGSVFALRFPLGAQAPAPR
jgi:signal transduction histidine kinase